MWFAVLIICTHTVCQDFTMDEPMRTQAECLIRAQPIVAQYVGARGISLLGREWAIGCKLGEERGMSTIQTLNDQDFRDIVRLLKIARGAAMKMDYYGLYAKMKEHNLARGEFEELMAEWTEFDRILDKLEPDWR